MNTEIIKLSSLRSNLESVFGGLISRFKNNKQYDITLVIQENELLTRTEPEEDHLRQSKDKHNVVFNQNTLVLNQGRDIDQESISEGSLKPPCQSESRIPDKKSTKMIMQIKKGQSLSSSGGEAPRRKFKHETIRNNYAQTDPVSDGEPATELKIEDDKEYSMKLNNELIGSINGFKSEDKTESETESSAEESDSNAGFLIEKHLNQALQMVEDGRVDDLEDFLYNYKQKYSFINLRTQTKWTLLMAHCKQTKREYERAAINYGQVVDTLNACPRLLTIDMGDLYFKLARCYYETGLWNKGIGAFTCALNQFKQSKKVGEYCNCITGLGILYLEINQFVQAEKCFLLAYSIKRAEGDKNNRLNLTPTLFHLVDCNLSLKNYTQTANLLALLQDILSQSQNPDPLQLVTLKAKTARLQYFLGNQEVVICACLQAIDLLHEHRMEGREYGEVLQILGLVKQEQGEYAKSRQYFDRALKAVEKYCSGDSLKVQVLKKRVETLGKFSNDHREGLPFSNALDRVQNIQSRSSLNSDCLDLNIYQK